MFFTPFPSVCINVCLLKLARSDEQHAADSRRIVQENVVLLREINDLRRELADAKTSNSSLEATLKSSKRLTQMRSKSASAASPAALNAAFAPPPPAPSLGEVQEIQQVERIIEIQKEEIRRLRSQLGLTASALPSRPTSGRLPTLHP